MIISNRNPVLFWHSTDIINLNRLPLTRNGYSSGSLIAQLRKNLFPTRPIRQSYMAFSALLVCCGVWAAGEQFRYQHYIYSRVEWILFQTKLSLFFYSWTESEPNWAVFSCSLTSYKISQYHCVNCNPLQKMCTCAPIRSISSESLNLAFMWAKTRIFCLDFARHEMPDVILPIGEH